MKNFKRSTALAVALAFTLAAAGCAEFQKITGLTPAQQVTLVAEFVNGACVISAAGISIAQVDNSILHPNAATGGGGASAAGTLMKAAQLTVADCNAVNGVIATVSGATASAPTS